MRIIRLHLGLSLYLYIPDEAENKSLVYRIFYKLGAEDHVGAVPKITLDNP